MDDVTDRHQNYFACLGPARSGTTWLHRYLRDHSTAKMTTMKEIHWFDTATGVKPDRKSARMAVRWANIRKKAAQSGRPLSDVQLEVRDRALMKSDADYRRFFTDRFGPDDTFGDVTPSYWRLTPDGFGRMLDVFPEAKIVFLMRNPTDAMWSRAAHAISNGGAQQTQDQIVRSRLTAEASAFDLPPLQDIHSKLVSVFHPHRIHCVFTEDLFSDNADATLTALCNFLGVKGAPVQRHTYNGNRGIYDPMPKDLRHTVACHYRQTYAFAKQHMKRLPEPWERDMQAIL
ncbi:sulfotransferase [Ascidiaceihabitans sp.]|uniref:sulfotransferase family protein n=1 Tax=Ascidiaceihabitans sp. TaxID=1872644 RepID=UPI003298080E